MDPTVELAEFLETKFGINHAQYHQLASSHTYEDLVTLLCLLGTKNPTSSSRRSGKRKIQDWVQGLSEYPRPLPTSMYKFLRPRWPTTDIEATISQIAVLVQRVTHQQQAASKAQGQLELF